MMLIPFGYSGASIPIEQLESRQTWRGLHPEFRRRVHQMLVAGDGRLGVGQGWRSSAVQEATFRQRHVVVASGGCCVFDGQRWALKPGNAHAAPPGLSFHESQRVDGGDWAMAADMVGDLAWMHTVCHAHGLKHFANVNSEPWHIQLVELPNSVAAWKAAGSPPPAKPAPPAPQTPRPPVDPEEDDDMAQPAICAIYEPTPQLISELGNPEWFGLMPDGSVRHVAAPDVQYADANGVKRFPIANAEQHRHLKALAAKWRA